MTWRYHLIKVSHDYVAGHPLSILVDVGVIGMKIYRLIRYMKILFITCPQVTTGSNDYITESNGFAA